MLYGQYGALNYFKALRNVLIVKRCSSFFRHAGCHTGQWMLDVRALANIVYDFQLYINRHSIKDKNSKATETQLNF